MRYFCFPTSLLLVGILAGVLPACSHKQSLPNHNFNFNSSEPLNFSPHKDWIGLQLPYAPFEDLRQSIERSLGKDLKNRSEAHITVLTPPEFQSLGLEMNLLEERLKAELQKSKWTPVCVGVGEKGPLQTYYVVVASSDLFEVRRKIATIQKERKSGQAPFDPEHFYPHVTLGYTERDLHEQDGVIKDANSCRFELQK